MKTLIKTLKENSKIVDRWSIEPFFDAVKKENTLFLHNKYHEENSFLLYNNVHNKNRIDVCLFKNQQLLIKWENKTVQQIITIVDFQYMN